MNSWSTTISYKFISAQKENISSNFLLHKSRSKSRRRQSTEKHCTNIEPSKDLVKAEQNNKGKLTTTTATGENNTFHTLCHSKFKRERTGNLDEEFSYTWNIDKTLRELDKYPDQLSQLHKSGYTK